MQYQLLSKAGWSVIWAEKTSSIGKRPDLQNALASLKPGDKLVVYKLDRLARSLKDLLGIIERLEQRGAGFQSLTEVIDTVSPADRLMLHMMGAFAEFERSLIRERSIADQRAARARGAIIGGQRSLPLDIETRLVERHLDRQANMRQLAEEFNIHESSVKRAISRRVKPSSSSLA